jgi:hypothetical protein
MTNPVRKILVMGLPGAGKTTLSRKLAQRLNAVHFNADEVRAHVNKDLGFSVEDRTEQAQRMGWLCDQVIQTGGYAIADFICPTPETRTAFGEAFVVWLDRIQKGRFEDTNRLFVPPDHYDVRVTADGAPEYWVDRITALLRPVFDPKRPTALYVGRWQPFHDAHKALVEEGLRRVGQVCIAVREVPNDGGANPFPFHAVQERIESALAAHIGKFIIVPMPNITHIFYGRDVGYSIERLELGTELETISGTSLRRILMPGSTGRENKA